MILFYLCLFTFSFCLTSAEKLENISEEEKILRFKDVGYEERKAYEKHNIRELLRNPDDYDIERPCEVYDKFCIRKFLTEHSRCKPVYGPVPDPLYRAQSTYYFPRINLTINSIDINYNGLNGRIEEFYINKRTDKLVLSVEFRNLKSTSNTTYFRFHRVGQEPYVNKDFLTVDYKSIVQTIIIPNLKNLLFEDSEVFTFSNDLIPIFIPGPTAFIGIDPTVQATLVSFLLNLPSNAKESLFLEGLYYIQSFVQYSLCDFELLLT